MRTPAWLKIVRSAAVPLLALCLLGADQAAPKLPMLPPIVFVSRGIPTGADAGQIPGLGPHGSTIIVGGRLLIRESSGAVRELVPHEKFTDVQDPDVSPDAKRVVFSAVAPGEKHWGLWSVGVDGKGLQKLANTWADSSLDAVDPCWYAGMIVFVDAYVSGRNLYDIGPRSQLWILQPDGVALPIRAQSPVGSLDPTIDPRNGRLIYSRWWYNPWRIEQSAAGSLTAHIGEHAPDDVNLWQPVSARIRFNRAAYPDAVQEYPPVSLSGAPRPRPTPHSIGDQYYLDDLKLAAGGVTPRGASTALQPCVLADGTIVGTAPSNTGCAPTPVSTNVRRFAPPPSPGMRIAGAAISDDSADSYSEAGNLSAPSACAPAALPDGRIIVSLDRGARGDFGLYVITPNGDTQRLLDLEGTSELDAAIVRPHRDGEIFTTSDDRTSFRFHDSDVFAGPGGPARVAGARVHFYAVWPPAAVYGIATAFHIAETPVAADGSVDRELPVSNSLNTRAMFETLTDSLGRVLMTAHGPAQVRGFNSGTPGSTVTCRGCHLGHSTLK